MSSNPDPIPRPTARVLLLSDEGRVLLFKWVDARVPLGFWITPGGGLDVGETYEQAALRELREETGLEHVSLGPCIWTRRHTIDFGHALIDMIARFFLVRTQEFTPTMLDPQEAPFVKEARWWSLEEIKAASGIERFSPPRLGELLQPIVEGWIPGQPIDVGA
ncbi:MAG: NUDIX domain-containing protein [Chloroflexi bacterium]|nr:NUDIX domain-containing protein [Chloroflexota bacterium]